MTGNRKDSSTGIGGALLSDAERNIGMNTQAGETKAIGELQDALKTLKNPQDIARALSDLAIAKERLRAEELEKKSQEKGSKNGKDGEKAVLASAELLGMEKQGKDKKGITPEALAAAAKGLKPIGKVESAKDIGQPSKDTKTFGQKPAAKESVMQHAPAGGGGKK